MDQSRCSWVLAALVTCGGSTGWVAPQLQIHVGQNTVIGGAEFGQVVLDPLKEPARDGLDPSDDTCQAKRRPDEGYRRDPNVTWPMLSQITATLHRREDQQGRASSTMEAQRCQNQ